MVIVMSKKKIIFIMFFVLLFIDQIIKILISNNMSLYDNIVVIPNFFSIYYLKNNGAAFSMLEGNSLFLVLIGIMFLIILFKNVKDISNISNIGVISYSMLFSGILGNIIDRCIYSGVIDYLSFNIFNYSFPVFNFADIMIVIGVLLFVIDTFRCERSK